MQVMLALILSSQRPSMEGRRERKGNRAGKEAADGLSLGGSVGCTAQPLAWESR